MKEEKTRFFGDWAVSVRPRSNHEGKKIWVLFNGAEVFSYDERGFRSRSAKFKFTQKYVSSNEVANIIPQEVIDATREEFENANN